MDIQTRQKGIAMLTSQDLRERRTGQGRPAAEFAELRSRMDDSLCESDMQRLRAMKEKLARVQALGGEYCRVALSPFANEALAGKTMAGV